MATKPITLNLDDANNELRFLLNELRAMDSGEDIPSDRDMCVMRLRWLALYLESGGTPPDAVSIVTEASRIPIQR